MDKEIPLPVIKCCRLDARVAEVLQLAGDDAHDLVERAPAHALEQELDRSLANFLRRKMDRSERRNDERELK